MSDENSPYKKFPLALTVASTLWLMVMTNLWENVNSALDMIVYVGLSAAFFLSINMMNFHAGALHIISVVHKKFGGSSQDPES